MKKVTDIGLIILLRLLCNDINLLFAPSEQKPVNELIKFIDITLWQFYDAVSFDKTRSLRFLPITVTNRVKLQELIHQYVIEYISGELTESKASYISYKALLKEFKASIAPNMNHIRYVINDLKYMPVILAMYDEDHSCVKEVNIELTSCADVPYPVKIKGNERWTEYFTYKVVVDISKLFKRERTKTKRQGTDGETLKNYTPKIRQFDLFLTDLVRNGTYNFSKMDVIDKKIVKSVGGFTTMFSRYKDVYKQCYPEYTFENNKPETCAVMYNPVHQCYDIIRIDPETKLYIGIENHLCKG